MKFENAQDEGKYWHSVAVWAYIDYMLKLEGSYGTCKDELYPFIIRIKGWKYNKSKYKSKFNFSFKRKENFWVSML